MTPALLRFAASLLDAYREELASHGCNDYGLPADLMDEDVAALAALANRWTFGDRVPGVEDLDAIETPDGMREGTEDTTVVGALAYGLREMAAELERGR